MGYKLIEDLQKQAIRGSRHTMPMPVSANLLARQFNEALPNLACVCNITCLRMHVAGCFGRQYCT